MYTKQEYLSPSSSQNWFIVFSLLFVLLLASVSINAQAVSEKITFTMEETEDYTIKQFTVKEINNTLYFKFLVVENDVNTGYTLESSSNGTDFYAVQLKEGFISPNGTPLLYCYTVNQNLLNDKMYRIRRDSPGGVSFSSILEVDNKIHPLLSAQKN